MLGPTPKMRYTAPAVQPLNPYYENINQALPALQNGQGVLGRPALSRPSLPATPTANSPAGVSALAGLFGKLKSGAAGLARDPNAAPSTRNLDVLNAGLGVAGAVNFATAKKPSISRPETFSSVTPVQNYEADRNAGYNSIAQNASTAMNNVRSQLGGDWGAYASAALAINAQSNQAQAQVNGGIGQQKREDNINLAQQMTQDKAFNYETQRSFDEAQYNQGMEDYQGQRAQGAGMMQGSLNYLVGQNAANRQFAEKQVAADQAIQGTAMEYNLRGAANAQQRDDVMYQNPQLRRYMSPQGQERYDFQPQQTTGFANLSKAFAPLTGSPQGISLKRK